MATPDVETFSLREGDEFIVLACDGIWDVMSNQEVGGQLSLCLDLRNSFLPTTPGAQLHLRHIACLPARMPAFPTVCRGCMCVHLEAVAALCFGWGKCWWNGRVPTYGLAPGWSS